MDAPKFTLDDTRTQADAAPGQNGTQVQLQPAPVVAHQDTGMQMASMELGGDDWSLMDVEPISTQTSQTVESIAPVSGVTDALQLNQGATNKNVLYGAFALVLMGAVALLYFPSGSDDSFDQLVVEKAPVARAPQAKPAPVVTPQPSGPPANPYWALPNIKPAIPPLGPSWSAQDEEIYRAGMTHRFNYQKYKAVVSVRRGRLAGSETILREAMGEPKLWTRMQAAFGLVEMGVDFDLAMTRRLIADAKSWQIHNYVKRLQKQPAQAELFVLRQMVRLVDERTRLLILQILHQHHDPLAGLYLTAAAYDPGQRVNGWAKGVMAEGMIAANDLEHYQRVVMGIESYRAPLLAVAPKPAVTTQAKTTEYTVEKIAGEMLGAPSRIATDEDIGDIEFFDSAEGEETLRYNPDDGFDGLKAKVLEQVGDSI